MLSSRCYGEDFVRLGSGAISLFLLAAFHADVVLGLAGLPSVVLCAGLLLLAALLTAVRLFSLQRRGSTKEQHHRDKRDGSHDDFLDLDD